MIGKKGKLWILSTFVGISPENPPPSPKGERGGRKSSPKKEWGSQRGPEMEGGGNTKIKGAKLSGEVRRRGTTGRRSVLSTVEQGGDSSWDLPEKKKTKHSVKEQWMATKKQKQLRLSKRG